MPNSNKRNGLPPAKWYEDMMAAARKRRAYVLELVAQGKTRAEIGEILGVTQQRASILILKAQREKKVEAAAKPARVSRGTRA